MPQNRPKFTNFSHNNQIVHQTLSKELEMLLRENELKRQTQIKDCIKGRYFTSQKAF